jgi:exonuclease SbcC
MRVHHLTATAFGPFPGTVEVDFDELNDAGVFLVTGPTGAGKTSLLDAVCFALYGVVPGVRDVKSLRSHHAQPQTRPQVVLEATISGRRFRITRSPEWQRPKKPPPRSTRSSTGSSSCCRPAPRKSATSSGWPWA